jgi:hypothetical protein
MNVIDVLDQVETGSVNGIPPSRAFERLAGLIETDVPISRMVSNVESR